MGENKLRKSPPRDSKGDFSKETAFLWPSLFFLTGRHTLDLAPSSGREFHELDDNLGKDITACAS